jgi:hypothetical protein
LFFFSFIPPPCRFWRVGDESDDDDSDDLHNFDVVNVCVKKGKENYMHVVEIKWVFSGKLVCAFVFVLVFFLFTIGVFCFIFSVCKGKKKVFIFFLFVIIFT